MRRVLSAVGVLAFAVGSGVGCSAGAPQSPTTTTVTHVVTAEPITVQAPAVTSTVTVPTITIVTTTATATITAVVTTTATAPATATVTARAPADAPAAPAPVKTENTADTANTPDTPIADIPGPNSGPACAAAPKYSDEPTTGLQPEAARAWKTAVTSASRDDITLCLNDGKRSRAQQQAIYHQYVREYGRASADQLVLPPNKSAHITGLAVDVQPTAGHTWLEKSDGALGWCRIYDNEPWHFEYHQSYVTGGCPKRLPAPQR